MPLLAVGLAATAVGTGLEVAANVQDQHAINSAESAQTVAQQGFQKQASSALATNLAKQGAEPMQKDMATGQGSREAITASLADAAAPATRTGPGQSADPATARASMRDTSAGNAWADVANTAATKEGSYGDWSTALSVGNADTNQKLGVIANKSQGTARLLPLQVQAAAHKGDSLSGWGQIISALGAMTSLYGATAAPTAAAGVASGANEPLSIVNSPNLWADMFTPP